MSIWKELWKKYVNLELVMNMFRKLTCLILVYKKWDSQHIFRFGKDLQRLSDTLETFQ